MVIVSKYKISIYFSVWEYFPDIFCLSDGGCIFSPQPQQWTGWQAVVGTGYLCLNILTYSRDSGQRWGSPLCGLWLVHLPCTGLWLAGSDQLLTWCGGRGRKMPRAAIFCPGLSLHGETGRAKNTWGNHSAWSDLIAEADDMYLQKLFASKNLLFKSVKPHYLHIN